MTQRDLNQALIQASYRGYTKIVKLLLEHGADVHAFENDALRVASRLGHGEVVKLLEGARRC